MIARLYIKHKSFSPSYSLLARKSVQPLAFSECRVGEGSCLIGRREREGWRRVIIERGKEELA